MHRTGHFGMTLFWAAVLTLPLSLTLSVPLAVLMVATEPLPDYDMKLSFIDHRGYSHTVLAAVLIAVVFSVLAGGIRQLIVRRAATLPDGIGVDPIVALFPPLPTVVAITFIGTTLGLLSHFTADMITVGEGYYGVQPLKPLSDWECGIQLCRADSTRWNGALLTLGSVAIAASGYTQYRVLNGGI